MFRRNSDEARSVYVHAFVLPPLESIDLVGSWIEAKDPKPLSEFKPGLSYSAGASNIDKRENFRWQTIRDRLPSSLYSNGRGAS
jgi:hypothetical protein